jgi:hypothetical protein
MFMLKLLNYASLGYRSNELWGANTLHEIKLWRCSRKREHCFVSVWRVYFASINNIFMSIYEVLNETESTWYMATTGCGKLTSFFIWIYSYKKESYIYIYIYIYRKCSTIYKANLHYWMLVCYSWERGRLIRVNKIEELLGRKRSGSGLEIREYGREDPLRWPRYTLDPQRLALTSPTSGCRSVGIVRLRTKAIEILSLMSAFSHISQNSNIRSLSPPTCKIVVFTWLYRWLVKFSFVKFLFMKPEKLVRTLPKNSSWVWNGVHSASWVQLRSYLIEK